VIPIVKKSFFFERLSKVFPMILVDQWSDLRVEHLTRERYDQEIIRLNDWHDQLCMKYYRNKIQEATASVLEPEMSVVYCFIGTLPL
jgi:hypothetical protein